jgi:hypothetical protein
MENRVIQFRDIFLCYAVTVTHVVYSDVLANCRHYQDLSVECDTN